MFHSSIPLQGAGTEKHVRSVIQSLTTFPVGLRAMAASKDIRSLRESQLIVWDETGVRVTDIVPIGEAGNCPVRAGHTAASARDSARLAMYCR